MQRGFSKFRRNGASQNGHLLLRLRGHQRVSQLGDDFRDLRDPRLRVLLGRTVDLHQRLHEVGLQPTAHQQIFAKAAQILPANLGINVIIFIYLPKKIGDFGSKLGSGKCTLAQNRQKNSSKI
jgi:hypothetical protein